MQAIGGSISEHVFGDFFPDTVGTSRPKGTNGEFVNPEDDGTILFCGTEQREETGLLSHWQKQCCLVFVSVIGGWHRCQTTAFPMLVENTHLGLVEVTRV